MLGNQQVKSPVNRLFEEQPSSIDIIVGPDGYRDLPKLLAINRLTREKAVNVLLSLDETYADVMPSVANNAVTGFVSIMRGCDNVCSDLTRILHDLADGNSNTKAS